jgi:hypothetical protein
MDYPVLIPSPALPACSTNPGKDVFTFAQSLISIAPPARNAAMENAIAMR